MFEWIYCDFLSKLTVSFALMRIIVSHFETYYLFALLHHVLTHTNLSNCTHSVWSLSSVLSQAAVKSMQHASRSLRTSVCVPAVCLSLHSANTQCWLYFKTSNPIGFVRLSCNLQQNHCFCSLLYASMICIAENQRCEVEGFNLYELTEIFHRLIW